MSDAPKFTVNVELYLGINKFNVDEEFPHIELSEDIQREEFLKLVRVCPAALYKLTDEGEYVFDYAGCLECGTCRIACGKTIVKKWDNPQPAMGINYRFG